MRTISARRPGVAVTATLILSLVAGLAVSAQAQPSPMPQPAYEEAPRTTFGVRAGINTTDFYGRSVELAEPQLGFNAGLFFTYRFAPNVALQPEVSFSTLAGKVMQSRVFESSGTIEYELGYLDLPVLLKTYLPRTSDTQLYLFAGPYVGVNLYNNAHDARNSLNEVDLDGELRSTQFGTLFGLGFDGYARGHSLSVDLRYKLGLTNLFEQEDWPGFRNRGFMVSVGFGF